MKLVLLVLVVLSHLYI